MMATCARPRWRERTVRLKFSVGGVLLFPVRFHASVYEGAWETVSTDPDEAPAAFDRLAPPVRAVLIGSHPVDRTIARVAFRRRYIRYCRMQFRRFFIEIEGNFDDYLDRSGRRRRHHLRAVLKQYGSPSDALDWREYRGERGIAEFHRLAREVSRKSWQERICDAGMPANEEFLDELREAAREDAVRGYVLFADETPIAYQYCPVQDGVMTCERIGYDPEFRGHSPGTVLLLLTLRHLFETHEFHRFDFGAGGHSYKDRYATHHVQCAEIFYFRHGALNTALVLAHAGVNSIWEMVRGMLERAGVRQRLKNFVHFAYVVRCS